MEKYIREQSLVEVQFFDGTKACAEELVKWAGNRLMQATTGYGEEVLLINTYGNDWFAVSGNSYIAKASDGYINTLTEAEFKREYIKI